MFWLSAWCFAGFFLRQFGEECLFAACWNNIFRFMLVLRHLPWEVGNKHMGGREGEGGREREGGREGGREEEKEGERGREGGG